MRAWGMKRFLKPRLGKTESDVHGATGAKAARGSPTILVSQGDAAVEDFIPIVLVLVSCLNGNLMLSRKTPLESAIGDVYDALCAILRTKTSRAELDRTTVDSW